MSIKTRGFSLLLIIIVLAAVAALGFGYLSFNKGETTEVIRNGKLEQVPGPVQSQREIEGTITTEGSWSRYTANDWKGFTFAYPSTWKLTERAYNPNVSSEGLSEVSVEGDGYDIRFSSVGKGLDTGVDTVSKTEVVSNHEVIFYSEKGYSAFRAVVSCSGRVGGVLYSPSGSREITDKIIASLKCPSFEE